MPLPLDLLVDRQSSLSSIVGMQGLQAYYDALTASSLTYTAATGATSLMADLSGNSNSNAYVCGVAASNGAYLTTGTAIGTGDFTLVCSFICPSSVSTASYFAALSSANNTSNVARAFSADIEASGAVRVFITGATTADYNYADFNGLISGYAGQRVTVTVVRSGAGTPTVYFNGVAQSVSASGSGGTAPGWNGSITSTYTLTGIYNSSQYGFIGPIFATRAYSSALNAAGVSADYSGTIQANNIVNCDFSTATKGSASFTCTSGQTVTITSTGATGARIAGARDLYQGTGANQPIYCPYTPAIAQASTSAITNTAFPADTLSGSSADGARIVWSTAGGKAVRTNGNFTIYPQQTVTVTFTAVQNSGTITDTLLRLTNDTNATNIGNSVALSVGANSITLTSTATMSTTAGVMFSRPNGNANCDLTISNLVVTVNAINQPGVFFDGSAFYLKSAPFTLNQPTWVVFIGKQLTFANNACLFAGNVNGSTLVFQDTTTPNISLYSGSTVATNTGLALKTTAVVTAVFNGASSSLNINNGVATTGNPGVANAGGFTVGVNGGGATGFGNILVNAVAIFSTAPTAADVARVVAYFKQRWALQY